MREYRTHDRPCFLGFFDPPPLPQAGRNTRPGVRMPTVALLTASRWIDCARLPQRIRGRRGLLVQCEMITTFEMSMSECYRI